MLKNNTHFASGGMGVSFIIREYQWYGFFIKCVVKPMALDRKECQNIIMKKGKKNEKGTDI